MNLTLSPVMPNLWETFLSSTMLINCLSRVPVTSDMAEPPTHRTESENTCNKVDIGARPVWNTLSSESGRQLYAVESFQDVLSFPKLVVLASPLQAFFADSHGNGRAAKGGTKAMLTEV